MTTATPRRSELEEIEERADEQLATEEGHVEADLEDAAAGAEEEAVEEEPPASVRLAVAAALPVIGAAVMVGGMFIGFSPRFYAGVAAIFGAALAVGASRIRNPVQSNLAIAAGLFGIGLLMLVPSGPDNLFRVRSLVGDASAAGNVLRPPVPFVPGWQAIIGWLMGVLGFLSAWTAVALRRPSLALLLPLPVAAAAGISVPANAQVASGIAVLVLFALALGVLSSDTAAGDDGSGLPLAYQVRNAVKAVPLLAAVTAALYFLAQADILFPDQLIDPAQEPQKPKTVPLTEVEDRVLFEVEADVSGPWRIGSLDVYDGKDWRLPPFAQSELDQVPKSGIVDADLEAGVKATFTVAGLGGSVLPALPNTVGIRASGPLLAYDQRNANIRLVNGQVQPGLEYEVVAAGLPSIDNLKAVTEPVPKDVRQFLEMPDDGLPPPAVAGLIEQAPKTTKWEQFDYLRTWILDNVTATGPGAPTSITPEKVQDMIAGSKEATPFEIVAAQAMLARWIEVPSRIGYGFDGGELVGSKLQVRPRNGASFVEVYFPEYKWLPVIGVPKKAKPTSSSDTSLQRTDPNILPSDDIAVRVVIPVVTPAPSVFGKQVQRVILIVVPLILLLLLGYFAYPAVRKAIVRSRRRASARAAGPRARVALAYAEWRDTATDLGCSYPSDTPLKFVHRFPPDEEHRELAWLMTRTMWGDLRQRCTPELAAVAEELARALRRRMSLAQPATLRAIAVVSRLSLRDPFLPHQPHREWAHVIGTPEPSTLGNREERSDAVSV